MRSTGDILLISTYELGHQPLHLASPLGFLEQAGYAPRALDLAVEPLDERGHVHAEVRARRDDVAVDARLDLALEEPVVGPWSFERCVPPGDVFADQADGQPGLLALGIEAKPAQQLEDVKRVRPLV